MGASMLNDMADGFHGRNGSSASFDRVQLDQESLLAKMDGEPEFLSPGDQRKSGTVRLIATADFPTRFGHFQLYGFLDEADGKEHTAIVKGAVGGSEACPVRVHSECHTGDVWGSLRCDCRDQLEASLRYIGESEIGAVVYLKQEGRGIGLLNKIKAYQLQDLGLDTVEANHFLGYPAESRNYGVAARILEILKVKTVTLLSNNPDKIEKLKAEGVDVAKRSPLVVAPNEFNSRYLETKRQKMGHLY